MQLVRLLPRFRAADRELLQLERRENWLRGEIEAFQLERLNAAWRAATTKTRHYRELCEQRRLPQRFRSLDEFVHLVPVLTKLEVRRDYDAFLARPRSSGEWVRTGGSTGEPSQVFWGRAAALESLRSRYRYYQMWGVDYFDRTAHVWGHGAALAPGLAGWIARQTQPLLDRLRNRLRLSAYDVTPARLRDYLGRIQRFGPAAVYGFPSVLELLAAEAEDVGFHVPELRLLTLTGETVYPRTVARLHKVFSAPATVEYGASECGPIAHERPDGKLCVREDLMLVETLPLGEERYEIVVSVLFNDAFPLLRYRMSDLTAAPLLKPARGFAELPQVLGRDNDHLITKELGRLHSGRLEAFFKFECCGVRRFRVRQERDGAVVVQLELNACDPVLVSRVERRLAEWTGYSVRVEARDEIPLTPSSKLRSVQSELARALDAPLVSREFVR